MAARERDVDLTLRDRLKRGDDGQHEAVLAWIVRGTVDWYANGGILPPAPPNVAADTRSWREDSDPIVGFVGEHLIFDEDRHVATTELLAVFNAWLRARGHREWSDQTLSGRLKDHQAWQTVEYRRILASKPGLSRPVWPAGEVGNRYYAWLGVRFRTPADADDDPGDDTEDDAKPQVAQGAQGGPALEISPLHEKPLERPGHLGHTNGQGSVCPCSRPAPVDRESGLCQWCALKAGKQDGAL